jgi:hypothetical protein
MPVVPWHIYLQYNIKMSSDIDEAGEGGGKHLENGTQE